MAPFDETVLITGGTGFIASHCILATLRRGYYVRTTIRDLKRTDDVLQALKTGGANEVELSRVQFFAVDLMRDDGWAEACAGCTYVLHVASPFPPSVPKHEDDLIVPAREGTLRALKYAKQSGTVKRVVATSSFAAVGYGYGRETNGKTFTEEDWSILDGSKGGKVPPYPKSKTLAERAARDWIEKEGGDLEFATVNPVGVFGPVLSGDFAASVQLVSRLLLGQVPAVPHLNLGIVDVRDVAELHLLAMTEPQAKGQRYLAMADGGDLSFKEIAMMLKKGLTAKESKKVTTRTVPTYLVKVMALFDPAVALIVPELDKRQQGTSMKAKTELGWKPRGAEEAILASARSLIECGVVKP